MTRTKINQFSRAGRSPDQHTAWLAISYIWVIKATWHSKSKNDLNCKNHECCMVVCSIYMKACYTRVVMSTNQSNIPYLKETWHTGVIVQTTAVAKKAIKRMLRPITIGTMVKAAIVQHQAISPGSKRTKTNNLTLIQKNIIRESTRYNQMGCFSNFNLLG